MRSACSAPSYFSPFCDGPRGIHQRVLRNRACVLGDLHAARSPGRCNRNTRDLLQSREELKRANLLRDRVMLSLIPERARHPTAARVAELYIIAAKPKQLDTSRSAAGKPVCHGGLRPLVAVWMEKEFVCFNAYAH